MLTPPFNRRLGIGHVLALTARQSGVWQLGATYGITPFRTGKWTASELGQLYDRPLRDRKQFVRLLRRMRRTNATHLVLSEPTLGRKLASTPSFSLLLREGRFTLLHLNGATSRWVEAGSPHVRVGAVDFLPGRVRIQVASRAKAGALLVKEERVQTAALQPDAPWSDAGRQRRVLVMDHCGGRPAPDDLHARLWNEAQGEPDLATGSLLQGAPEDQLTLVPDSRFPVVFRRPRGRLPPVPGPATRTRIECPPPARWSWRAGRPASRRSAG